MELPKKNKKPKIPKKSKYHGKKNTAKYTKEYRVYLKVEKLKAKGIFIRYNNFGCYNDDYDEYDEYNNLDAPLYFLPDEIIYKKDKKKKKENNIEKKIKDNKIKKKEEKVKEPKKENIYDENQKKIMEENKMHIANNKPSDKFLNLKNKTFIHNSKCPLTDRFVLKVWGWKYRKLSHREVREGKKPVKIRSMLWEYYRDRKRQSVGQVMRKLISSRYFELEMFHSGFSQSYMVRFTEEEKIKLREHKKTEVEQKIRYAEERHTMLKYKLGRIERSDSKKREELIEKISGKIKKVEDKLYKYRNNMETESDKEDIMDDDDNNTTEENGIDQCASE
jgi:hypothetical protein